MGCFTHTRCAAIGALPIRIFPGLVFSQKLRDFCGDYYKIPPKSVFLALCADICRLCLQPKIEELFLDFYRF